LLDTCQTPLVIDYE